MLSNLFNAILSNNLELVRSLMEEGIDTNVTNGDGFTFLHMACHLGHIEIAKLLIQKGADVNKAASNGFTPLYIACRYRQIKLAKFLIEKGAHVNIYVGSDFEFTPLHWVSDPNLLKMLIEKGADINARSIEDITPLHWACEENHREIAKLLIENKADVNIADFYGFTPLHVACESGHFRIARLLIENGANINVCNSDGFTSLHMAYAHSHIELAKYLIQHSLLKNSHEKKPKFVKEHQDLSVYWNEQIEKINYLPQKEVLGGKTLTEDILNNLSRKSSSLLSLSFNQLFKSLNPEVIKNKTSQIDQQSDTLPFKLG